MAIRTKACCGDGVLRVRRGSLRDCSDTGAVVERITAQAASFENARSGFTSEKRRDPRAGRAQIPPAGLGEDGFALTYAVNAWRPAPPYAMHVFATGQKPEIGSATD
jgi:hypothetical protein